MILLNLKTEGQIMIYTLTLNPALDYIMELSEFAEGKINRSYSEKLFPAGKGTNVSLMLSRLGVPSVSLGFTAGFTGEYFESSIKKAGVECNYIRLAQGFTRINPKLRSCDETDINGKGPTVTKKELEKMYAVLSKIGSGDTLVLAGSLPDGVPDNIYSDILHLLPKGVETVVDTHGKQLSDCLGVSPFLIKPNLDELCELCGKQLCKTDQILSECKKLQEAGAKNVLCSLGKNGALLVLQDGKALVAKAPSGRAVNTAGAGDSMVAGFLAGLSKGEEYALSLAIAAGSATAFCDGLGEKDEIFKLMNSGEITVNVLQ